MSRGVILLMAAQLPSVLLLYWVGTLFVKKLRLTSISLIAGFFAAWILGVLISLLLAESPTLTAASNQTALAGLLASVIALVCITYVGKRKEPDNT
jgi:uncharacterized membrane protein